jgi:hypothetical protein
LYLIAVIGAVLCVVLLVLPFKGYLRWWRTRGHEDAEKRAKRPGLTLCGAEVLGAIALGSLAVAAVSLVAAVASYTAMSEKTLCAIVTAEPHPNLPRTMIIEYTPVTNGREGTKVPYYSVKGDLWGLEGNILRWSGWMRMLGLKTCYRVTRLSGKYSPPARGEHPTEVYFGGEDHWLWRRMQRYDYRIPGIEASWHTGAHRPPAKGATFEVWVTPGGYMIKRR